MSQESEDERKVAFGAETQTFITGAIGKYLLARSLEEVTAALEQLKVVPPESSIEIRRLQNIIQRNEGVEQWLKEIIHDGWEAQNLLAGEES